MTRVRAEALQWYGLFGAALAWTVQHVISFGVAYGSCAKVGPQWGLDVKTWVIVLTAVGGSLALLAEAAAISVLVATWGTEYDGPPSVARRHFFAWGAALGNVLFLGAIALNCVGALANSACRPI